MPSTIHLLVYPREDAPGLLTFEEFAEKVADWQGMYFEMDGSFVWSIRASETGQIDGMVYDRNLRIEYLDLKGAATATAWLRLLQTLVSKEAECFEDTADADSFLALEPLFRVYDVRLGDFSTLRKCFSDLVEQGF